MPHRSIRAAINLVIAIAITVGALLSSAHVVAGHNPYATAATEAARHAELASEAAEHGHAHNEGDPAEKQPGHVHGHNPGDHLHEPFGLTAAAGATLPVFAVGGIRPVSEPSERGIKIPLRRPPRLLIG